MKRLLILAWLTAGLWVGPVGAQGPATGRASIEQWLRAKRFERIELGPQLIAERATLVPILRSSLTSGSRSEKLLACALLPELRDWDAVPGLIAATSDVDSEVQRRAVTALRRLGDRRAAPRLREIAATTGDRALLKRATAGIGRVGNTSDAVLLQPRLLDTDESVRVIAAGALAMLGDESGRDVLLAATRSDNPQARKNATFGLGFFSDVATMQRLEEIVSDPTGQWRSYAAMALSRRETIGLPLKERIARLVEFGKHRDRQLATWALDELTEIGAPHALPALREIAGTRSRVKTLAGYRLAILAEGRP